MQICILLIKDTDTFKTFQDLRSWTQPKIKAQYSKRFTSLWNCTYFLLFLRIDTLKYASAGLTSPQNLSFLVTSLLGWGLPSWNDYMEDNDSMILNLLLVGTTHHSFPSEKGSWQTRSCNDICELLPPCSAISEFPAPLTSFPPLTYSCFLELCFELVLIKSLVLSLQQCSKCFCCLLVFPNWARMSYLSRKRYTLEVWCTIPLLEDEHVLGFFMYLLSRFWTIGEFSELVRFSSFLIKFQPHTWFVTPCRLVVESFLIDIWLPPILGVEQGTCLKGLFLEWIWCSSK